MKISCTRRGALIWTAVLFVNSIVFPVEGQSVGYERSRAKSILKQVSKNIEKNFYDPELHGLNWKELTDQTRERIEGANSVNEMLTAIFSLVDKLQDSHTVFLPPERVATPQFGFTAKAFGQEIRIYELNEDGPAAKAGFVVCEGEFDPLPTAALFIFLTHGDQ